MSRLSAADLQRAHEATSHSTNGTATTASDTITEDPFPPFGTAKDPITVDPFPPADAATSSATPEPAQPAKPINLSDESLFPSLGGPVGKKAGGGPTWGSGGAAAQRIKATAAPSAAPPSSANGHSRSATPLSAAADDTHSTNAKSNFVTTTVQLAARDIHVSVPNTKGRGFSNREPEPTTLGEVMQYLMKKHPSVTVEASTSRQITTFIIKGKGKSAEDEVAVVKKELLARLAKKVKTEVEIPSNLRALIIGAKGRTLKQITESTGADIQIPRDDENDSSAASTAGDSPDGPLISVVISGDSSAVALAKSRILAIVAERVSKVQTKMDNISKEFWPHLKAKVPAVLEKTGAQDSVSVFVPRAFEKRGLSVTAEGEEDEVKKDKETDKAIIVSGEREAVAKVVEALETELVELKRTSKTLTIGVNKRQHRFLVGSNADEIMETTGCSIELPSVEDANENVTIRGPQNALANALNLVMAKANATPVETLDLSTAHRGNPDPKAYSSHVTRYILRKGKFRALSEANSVNVYLPRPSAIEAGAPLIEIVGKDASSNIDGARKAIIDIVRTLPPANFRVVHVDSLIHRHLIGKKGQKIKTFEEKNGVDVVFPPDGEDRPDILLVFTGEGKADEILEGVSKEIQQMAKEAADIQTVTLTIPQTHHRTIIGQGGTTLNAVIGEEKLVNVSFGKSKGDGKANGKDAGDDQVVIRGPSEDVLRVQKEIERIAEDAKNSDIVNSHTIEFEVETLHVRHIVGKSGAGINKLRDDLGVRVDFEELGAGTKKRTSKVTIKGRKENAEEAKKRIIAQAGKLADETTLIITLPSTVDRGSLIGKQGSYLKRLETKYDVRINFPKDGKKGDGDDDDKGGPSDVTIRGGRKGAEAAKKELVDLIDLLKEHGNVLTFTVSVKSLPRILGKSGASINQMKEETQVTVDVDQASEDAVTATVSLRGTKTGTQAAKKQILAIAQEVDDETRLTMEIPREFHTTLIGSGGSSIRDLISRAGGPTDARASGNTVRFPRQGDSASSVVITAPTAVANKIKAALEKEVASLQSRVVWGAAVPQSAHASIIGKGASALQELQRKHGVKVIMPGWSDHPTAGEVANPADVEGAEEGDIVKIIGPREAAIAAAAELSKGRAGRSNAKETISVPVKYHAKLAQGGRFFRSLPNGTRVTHNGVKPPSSTLKAKKPAANGSAARIDDDDASAENEVTFQLVPLYDGTEEDDSEIPWVIESSTPEDAEKVVAELRKALDLAKNATHVAWVTVPRGLMPRIVGRGGAGLDKLRAGGVEVEVVGRNNANQLTLTGKPDAIDAAYQSILELNAPRPSRERRERDDY